MNGIINITQPTITQHNLTAVQAVLAGVGITSEIVAMVTDVLMVDLRVGNAQLMIVDPAGLQDLTGDSDDYRWSFQVFDDEACEMVHEQDLRAAASHREVAKAAVRTFTDYVSDMRFGM